MKVLLLKSWIIKIIIVLALLLLSTFVVTNRTATTKVTWEERWGIPFTVIIINKMSFGPCGMIGSQCTIRLTNMFPLNLFLNALSMYLIVSVFWILFKSNTIRSWLLNLPDRGTRA
jgi:uncharacterized integral membrane protein